MRVALTFNLRRSSSEEDAELDSRETVAFLAGHLADLGHDVTLVEATCSIRALDGRLRRAAPDVVFNIAEGLGGAFREALYPALFEQLGLPHTGSRASVLALCLDKAMTCKVARAAGVPVPRGCLVRRARDAIAPIFPAIVKPNFEGSSKGITQDAVVTDASSLERVVAAALERHAEGVLVEELVPGADVSVAWFDGLGLLPAFAYDYEPTGAHHIFDYALKHGPADRVRALVPAPLDAKTSLRLRRVATRAFESLGVTGYGRADFRVTPGGDVRFLEMNPLPTLAPSDDELYRAAALAGASPQNLIANVLASATRDRLVLTRELPRAG